MSSQYRAFQGGVDRMSSLHTGRFALQALEEDIRTLGTNVPAGQPAVGVAGTNVVAFMADNVTNISSDPFGRLLQPGRAFRAGERAQLGGRDSQHVHAVPGHDLLRGRRDQAPPRC